MSPREFVALEFPSWLSWGQRRGAFIDNAALAAVHPDHKHYQRYVETIDGEPYTQTRIVGERYRCGWCAAPCPKRRTSWCSDACSQQFYRVWNWAAVTKYIRERDADTCQRCGTTEPGEAKGARYDAWDVDHIVPIRNGGTDDPANLRLLCYECHVAVGYEQRAAERAECVA